METSLRLGIYWDNGKENENFFKIGVYIGRMVKKMETSLRLGIYWDHGKENGNFFKIRGEWKRKWKLL